MIYVRKTLETSHSLTPHPWTDKVSSSGGVFRGCCHRRHRVAWEMESKLALDASERGHGQPEASDVVGVGRRQADPRLGGGLRASRLSVVCRERQTEDEARGTEKQEEEEGSTKGQQSKRGNC